MSRPSRTSPTSTYPLADRGVYVECFTTGRLRGCYAVDSRGELVAYRSFPKDAGPSTAVVADLWDELNEADPPTIRARRSLELMS